MKSVCIYVYTCVCVCMHMCVCQKVEEITEALKVLEEILQFGPLVTGIIMYIYIYTCMPILDLTCNVHVHVYTCMLQAVAMYCVLQRSNQSCDSLWRVWSST